ncbi:hypothetical protein OIE43_41770 [Streptomyces pseudovenezuelae]|uniref:hypothetical protein n=1 Tax=Streptomyces pseudovenezuelae TaxID=67350 RepID=UPI002E34E7E9|nr:hypothetical protein [Streptomyces pseudovenezuelae]
MRALTAPALGASVLEQESGDVEFCGKRAEDPHERDALGVASGEVLGKQHLRGDRLRAGA